MWQDDLHETSDTVVAASTKSYVRGHPETTGRAPLLPQQVNEPTQTLSPFAAELPPSPASSPCRPLPGLSCCAGCSCSLLLFQGLLLLQLRCRSFLQAAVSRPAGPAAAQAGHAAATAAAVAAAWLLLPWCGQRGQWRGPVRPLLLCRTADGGRG